MILAAIAKSGDHQCGWANALKKSGKACLFSPIVLTEQVPPSLSKPKRPILSEESKSLDKQLKKRRLEFFNEANETREDIGGVLH